MSLCVGALGGVGGWVVGVKMGWEQSFEWTGKPQYYGCNRNFESDFAWGGACVLVCGQLILAH